ncbi:MAG TPA: muconolactone Delta-isomerase family protein [Puia sp.]
MRKFQVTIQFEMNDEFASLVPSHRTYINRLIEQGIIDHYVVTMETQRVWITFSADDKAAVEKYLSKSPLHKFWTYEIDELFVVDGLHYRLPVVQLN